MIPTNPSWPDLILVLMIFLYTVYSAVTYRRTRERMISGELTRGRVYAEIILAQWSAVLFLTAVWWLGARSAGDLGMAAGLSSAWGIGAWAGVLLYSGYLLLQIWRVGRRPEAGQQFWEQVRELDYFLPRTRGQLWGLSAVGLTASICEEILYRGFLLWWCQEALGLGLMPAAVVSTVIFGLGHAYQGWQGIVRTGLMGALLMGIRLAAGSLWPAMVLHAAADILGGWLIYRARPDLDEATPTPPSGTSAILDRAKAAAGA